MRYGLVLVMSAVEFELRRPTLVAAASKHDDEDDEDVDGFDATPTNGRKLLIRISSARDKLLWVLRGGRLVIGGLVLLLL